MVNLICLILAAVALAGLSAAVEVWLALFRASRLDDAQRWPRKDGQTKP